MAFDSHVNFGYAQVATAPSPASSGTSLVVTAGFGSTLGTAPFNMTVWPTGAGAPTTSNAEIVRVTAISTDTLTITRAQEGTSARTIVIGDQIAVTQTVRTFTDIENGRYPRTAVADVAYAALTTDLLIVYTSITTGRTVTLPNTNTVPIGKLYIVKDETGGALVNNITLATTAAQTIDGAATKVVNTNYGYFEVYSNGTNWFTVS